MARKNEKPTADGTVPAASSPEEGATGDAAAVEEGSSDADPGAQALIEGLRAENDGLRKEVEALARERDKVIEEAIEASQISAEQLAMARARRRPEEKLLSLLGRLSKASERSGDRETHSALERVIVAFAEVRHAVRESVKTAKGDALDLLEDLEESL